MFVGHLPAGYLVSRALASRLLVASQQRRSFVLAGMLGAVAPDIDMFNFYFVDGRQHHHHLYLPHLPVVWLALLVASALWARVARNRAAALLAFVFSLNGMLHMLLDTIAGDIWWLGPWVDRPFAFVTVPARFQPWWLNFLSHWTFLFEILSLLLAILVWHRSRSRISP